MCHTSCLSKLLIHNLLVGCLLYVFHPVLLYEDRLEKYSDDPKLYFASLRFSATLRYCELANTAVTQLPQALLSPLLICRILFICPALYLPSLTNPIICIHMLFGFMWCEKEIGFGLIKRAVWSCMSLTVDGSHPNKSPPGCSDAEEQKITHTS